MKHPSNEACLAAELAMAYTGKIRIIPARAAQVAANICALGRRYKRLQEKLTGGSAEWGEHPEAGKKIEKAKKQCERLLDQARDEIAGWGNRARIETHDLHFSCVSIPRRMVNYHSETACS
jgi:hypothetical protein